VVAGSGEMISKRNVILNFGTTHLVEDELVKEWSSLVVRGTRFKRTQFPEINQ
jgi:hypothetical protein